MRRREEIIEANALVSWALSSNNTRAASIVSSTRMYLPDVLSWALGLTRCLVEEAIIELRSLKQQDEQKEAAKRHADEMRSYTECC